ncbi:hypothetical protein E2C01_030176 [Portunus trituberculatus]|uniref:Uncharacterized protein n=1 Tax=Portunus trituberculatus TaxID=210409 RepID=A0A5B7ETZ8_PORTR|nr:hypothetical protein [Portunus trituberculatus]
MKPQRTAMLTALRGERREQFRSGEQRGKQFFKRRRGKRNLQQDCDCEGVEGMSQSPQCSPSEAGVLYVRLWTDVFGEPENGPDSVSTG